MSKKSFFVFIISLLYCPQFSWGQIINKIDARLLNANSSVFQNIIVVLNEQANVTPALGIRGKNAKANYVFSTLTAHAATHQNDIKSFLSSKSVSYRSYYIVNMIALKAKWVLIDELALLPSVNRILLDGSVLVNNIIDPDRKISGARAIEWNVTQIGAPSVWAMGFTGQNVVIGGQDTGYEWNHAAIKSKYRGWNGTTADHNYNWHDAIREDIPLSSGSNPCGYNSNQPCDDHNHGTHTMGTMVGDDSTGNQIGIAHGAKWIGCRNMENGYGRPTTYLECFEWFLAPYALGSLASTGDPNKMPHVINNSWGCPTMEGCDTTVFSIMQTAVNNLKLAGCVVVVSAGNSGSSCSTVSDPMAIFENSFSVGATNSSDQIASFSSRGPVTVDGSNRLKPNISAPGVSVRSAVRGINQYATYSGTSMAGPHVAGLVALIISANPQLAGEVDKIEDIIEQTAINLTTSQICGNITGIPNNTFGFGRIDAMAAVNLAMPSSYTPYVNQLESFIIDNPDHGLVLVSPNNKKFKITVMNSGVLKIDSIMNLPAASMTVKNASLNLVNQSSKIILKSPDNSYWQININEEGNISCSLLSVLPSINGKMQNGDLIIDAGMKGIILRSPGNICFLTNISNLGNLVAVPAICLN